MRLAFDETKATQTAASFLKLAGGSLNYLALIKLLYRTDREALRRWGIPITTDRYASMRLGPVTSTIYDLIKASANQNLPPTFWSSHIAKSNVNVKLCADPGTSELSRAEERLISEVFAEHGSKDRFQLADECHRDFPEWKDTGTSSVPLEIEDIVDALNLSEEETFRVEQLVNTQRLSRRLVS